MALANTIQYIQQGTIDFIDSVHMMGMAVLGEHLRYAALVLTGANTANRKQVRIQDSMAFVKGSGLEIVIESYDLGVDSDAFRNTFYSWCKHWKNTGFHPKASQQYR